MQTESELIAEQVANLINHGLSNDEIVTYFINRNHYITESQLIGVVRLLMTRTEIENEHA